ncbi:MAG: fructose-bisphosphate aldolase class I [Chromatiales bacterium]|nr:fructose-bisphosphate aldolase class I [Chromatiales bacterium]
MNSKILQTTAQAMVAPAKGILAMDESKPTCDKRFAALGIPTTEENRKSYRSMLVTTPDIEQHISAAILFDETIRQETNDGIPFAKHLEARGIIPGIKVDQGAKALAGYEGEKVTEGLDGLRERLQDYAAMGARFAKWRAVITIGGDMPSAACIQANAHALARYAALCQEQDIVPIVEPEVLMDGHHSIDDCYEVTESTQNEVFSQLRMQGVQLDGIVLKPNMVISGSDCPDQADVYTVANRTLACLKSTVPAIVPGIAFLSGGQSDDKATAHLDAINRLADAENAPWRLTFSYGRALQQLAMKLWGESQSSDAQQAFRKLAYANGKASIGIYQTAS